MYGSAYILITVGAGYRLEFIYFVTHKVYHKILSGAGTHRENFLSCDTSILWNKLVGVYCLQEVVWWSRNLHYQLSSKPVLQSLFRVQLSTKRAFHGRRCKARAVFSEGYTGFQSSFLMSKPNYYLDNSMVIQDPWIPLLLVSSLEVLVSAMKELPHWLWGWQVLTAGDLLWVLHAALVLSTLQNCCEALLIPTEPSASHRSTKCHHYYIKPHFIPCYNW